MVVLRPVFKQAESTQESVDNKLHEVAEILQQLHVQCQPAMPATFISTSCLISKWQTCETVGHWFLHSVQVHLSCMFYWLTRVYLVSTHLAEHHLCTALANLAVEVPMFLRLSSSSFLARNSRLHSTIRRPHPPQRPVLVHIHCFRQCDIVGSQLCDAGCPRGLIQSSGGTVDRILLASMLSSIHAVCPKSVG